MVIEFAIKPAVSAFLIKINLIIFSLEYNKLKNKNLWNVIKYSTAVIDNFLSIDVFLIDVMFVKKIG